MGKIKSIIKGFGLSILFILMGVYILNITDSILGTIIGVSNISFFGILILWATFKFCKINC